MKLAFFNDYQLGVLTEDGVVDINDAISGISYLHRKNSYEW